ncbi:hypothetical protein EHQ68_00425 [Leptospira congkakensis]|uniref:Uncharacterized protein n=1 Tax=Leptospira congkakensis TaxID=2484932 RepID=A0A4Z1AC65_9LEPT|nr:hypothetical protein [Leptospira congkakensis]TGL87862.1 hypothetical protein EHQ69_17360 [Leptospira congkakensis]TGL92639.1 hypothetical protein EHQ68_00425 [Leptospira congkakensis]TGL96012.1 hypothetical protein EHQ70_13030 [Leptospira congkakensis]
MRTFILKSITVLSLSTLFTCSLFEKEDNKKEDMFTALLLSVWTYNQAAGCSGPKSGFTICIPKGIAE